MCFQVSLKIRDAFGRDAFHQSIARGQLTAKLSARRFFIKVVVNWINSFNRHLLCFVPCVFCVSLFSVLVKMNLFEFEKRRRENSRPG
jgi:hypothetical protein